MTQNELNTPWSLQFDRDGTEDYGIICDSEGNDLVASHITGSNTPQKWKDREFGEGCFWLPEEEGDPVPYLVQVMQLMTAAPKLYAALEKCHSMLLDYKLLAQARAVYFGVETGHIVSRIEATRQEAAAALANARGNAE